MPHPADEVKAAYGRYLDARHRVEAGELGWDALADFFTDDATFIGGIKAQYGLASAGEPVAVD